MKKPPIVGAAVLGRVHEGLMLRCLQRRRQGRRLAPGRRRGPEIRDHGGDTCREARQRERKSSLSRSLRVSSFRGLPQSATTPTAELSKLRLAKPSSINGFAGENRR
jgi:hypothetical protein